MRFFHLSDLHLGLKLINRDLDEDQRYILEQIAEAARREQPDAILVAGDIYDKAIPPAEAVTLLDDFIASLTAAAPDTEIMLISGNHDSAARLNLFRGLLSRQRVRMIGLPPRRPEERVERVRLTDEWGAVDFYLLPFVRPSMVRGIVDDGEEGPLSYDRAVRGLLAREEIDLAARNVLVSHQFYLPAGTDAGDMPRTDGEIRMVGDIDQVSAEALLPFDYAALGHLHRPISLLGGKARYCGAPLACSVSEAGQQKAILMVELREKGSLRVTPIPLKPLREIRVIRGALDEVLTGACDDFVSAVLTDKADLDVIDMRDRLAAAFPNLLEVRREGLAAPTDLPRAEAAAQLSPFELCAHFLQDPDDEARALLRDVINAVREAQ